MFFEYWLAIFEDGRGARHIESWKFSNKNISIVRALIGMSEFATFMSFRPTTHHANSMERRKDFLGALPDRGL